MSHIAGAAITNFPWLRKWWGGVQGRVWRNGHLNFTMDARATLSSGIVATMIGLKNARQQTKEIEELRGVCECLI